MFVEASVPGRVNFFGNPLDIYGGLVISSSIAMRATVTAQDAKGLLFAMGENERAIRTPSDLAHQNDAFDFLRALFRSLNDIPECQIRFTTDIPIQSGLAGSAALMLAATACVLTFAGQPASQKHILKTARRAEVQYLNNFCGWNDFYACYLGGTHQINYARLDDDNPAVEPLTQQDDDVSFAVALTGGVHRSGAVNHSLYDRWRNGDPAVRSEYQRLRELGPFASDAFKAKAWQAFGRSMVENFLCQYRLKAANDVENRLVQTAIGLGAFGAKLCGAGHCGSIVVLARNGDHARIGDGLRAAGAQQYFRVAPSNGLILRTN